VRKKLITLTTAGLLAVGGAAVAVPALAATDATSTATAGSSRVDRITEALAGLVSDGSITQEQADEVATTLASADLGGGHGGGHGGGPGGGNGLAAAATALGMSEDDLRTALQADGATLASVAEDKGVAVDTLIDALVTAAQESITQAVTDGDLTQEQADERLADLETRITDRVNSTGDDRPHRPADSEDDPTE
jgi:polyhydroxyalkanoate synthesis regulator phasin